ncbi:hypothetical protein SEUCBS140593_008787 [Sporothrix eucalyptigena]|uniref:N-acetylglucosaminylphosphatidylinositol deacetylase n=1 Tax=Sporothrix eucalyptigena TaxID=1812306 RepID=A0ABP0CPD4_9PEZI
MLLPPRITRLLAAVRRAPLRFSISLSRRAWRLLFQIALVALLFPPILQWTIAYLVGGDVRLLPQELQGAKNLLVVTAHPDDECLFFAPSILGVLDRNRGVHGSLLSMSTGNNYGIGDLRKKELTGSCAALQIDPARCIALDHPDLQDNPTVWWDTALVQTIVQEYIAKWDIDAILTFDAGGVSGHINHRAVSAAISELIASSPASPKTPVAYMIVTTPLWRKYTFLGDLPLTALRFTSRILAAFFFPSRGTEAVAAAARSTGSPGATASRGVVATSRALVANTWHRYQKTREAFRHHNSQYTWDRHLYMIVSRYVWFNDLQKVEPAQA